MHTVTLATCEKGQKCEHLPRHQALSRVATFACRSLSRRRHFVPWPPSNRDLCAVTLTFGKRSPILSRDARLLRREHPSPRFKFSCAHDRAYTYYPAVDCETVVSRRNGHAARRGTPSTLGGDGIITRYPPGEEDLSSRSLAKGIVENPCSAADGHRCRRRAP